MEPGRAVKTDPPGSDSTNLQPGRCHAGTAVEYGCDRAGARIRPLRLVCNETDLRLAGATVIRQANDAGGGSKVQRPVRQLERMMGRCVGRRARWLHAPPRAQTAIAAPARADDSWYGPPRSRC